MSTEEEFEGWAGLELMGHRRITGFVRIVSLAGIPTIRVDAELYGVPSTQYYAPSALYCLTPTSEEHAKSYWPKERPALDDGDDLDDDDEGLDPMEPF